MIQTMVVDGCADGGWLLVLVGSVFYFIYLSFLCELVVLAVDSGGVEKKKDRK